MDYGIQLYSVRDSMPGDVEGTLKQIAEYGYKTVEFAGFFEKTAEQIADLLTRYGLKALGAHVSLGEIEADTAGMMAYHKAIGNRYLIIPGHDLSTQAKLDDMIERVNALQPVLEAGGFVLAFHNHSSEFKPNQDGVAVYRPLLERTRMGIELDTYWVYVAGEDPLAWMDELGDRLISIHIKDGTGDGQGFTLGRGTAPVKAVHAKAAAMGVPMVVESETLNPDGLTEARLCIEFLHTL